MKPVFAAMLLLALAGGTAGIEADPGGLLLQCPSDDWILYSDPYEASCMKVMPEPKLNDQAQRACFDVKSRILSLQRKTSKIFFVNELLLSAGATGSLRTWFFDALGTEPSLVKPPNHSGARWLVISPNPDFSRIEIMVNMTTVPRSFVCEAPARPLSQRPQMQQEPEDVFIVEELLASTGSATTINVDRISQTKSSPFVVTFDCESFGVSKPTVKWVLVSGEDQDFYLDPINATIIHSQQLLQDQLLKAPLDKPLFFELKHDCTRDFCPPDAIQERSQLIVVNPQLLLAGGRKKPRIACLARNSFGSVLSREAQLTPTRLGQFARPLAGVPVITGMPTLISNAISTQPEIAAFQCFRVLEGTNGSAGFISMEEVNQASRGRLQFSRATFDFIVDAAWPADAGRYLCQVSLPHGRLGQVTRERTVILSVQQCQQFDCNIANKPVDVVPGYPAVISMNPFSSKVIRHGDSFMLECPCTGIRNHFEELLVEWNLNLRNELDAIFLPSLPFGSAMLVQWADSQRHSGNYRCRCHRGAVSSTWKSIDVDVLPSLTPNQWNQQPELRLRAGQNLNLNCSVPSFKDVVSVTAAPLNQTQPLLVTSDRFKVDRVGPGHFSLGIFNAQPTDSGVFGCRVVANYKSGGQDVKTYYVSLLVESNAP